MAALRVPFRKILVVVKHTPFESYQLLKAQGRAPLALRWERLKNRYLIHRECVSSVQHLLERMDVKYSMVGREELDRQHIEGVDLVIAVGGDGTVLSSSHFLDSSIPLAGVNSDPTRENERDAKKKADERRSFGALCCCTAANLEEVLPRLLQGEIKPHKRARIQTIVKSTFTETKLPPALNDILVAHPSPAAVSRFRMRFINTAGLAEVEHFSFNVWSSGIWISTATGSTAAMHAAGGDIMPPASRELQYMVREHLLEEGTEHLRPEGHGMVKDGSRIRIRWNSQHGCVYVDGDHSVHLLHLGDELELGASAPPLQLYTGEDGEDVSNGARGKAATNGARKATAGTAERVVHSLRDGQ